MPRLVLSPLALLLACGLIAPLCSAKDSSVEARLDARGLKYEEDSDGDYKLTFSYDAEGRSQLVFVSGKTETVGGFKIREIFAPAAHVSSDGIDGEKALELMAESNRTKLGSWELQGDKLLFVIKLPDNVDASQLEAALSIAAETADNKEIELSGDQDAL